MSSRPGGEPRSTGSRPTARRPGSRSAPTPSTRSTASRSRSSSRTTCCPATEPGRSWRCPRTTSATSPSPSSSACRSAAWSPPPGRPRTTRWPTPTSPTPRASAWSTAAPFDGMPADEGGKAIVAKLAEAGKAEPKVTYRLRDWLISRQRYWGTPIPIIYCETDGIVPVPDADLPVRLPENVDYKGRGDNPLNHDEAFLRVDCPRCGRTGATRDRHDGHVRRFVVVLVPLPVARLRRGAGGSRDGRCLDPGRPVHRWRRARRDAPDVQPVLDQGDARRRPGRSGRALPAACSTRARSSARTASGCRSPEATSRTRTSWSPATARTRFGCT